MAVRFAKEKELHDPLQALLGLTEEERTERGLCHTPREICQQPETWLGTYRLFQERKAQLRSFLKASGVGYGPSAPVVFLIGAGTSDYIGRALENILRQRWGCEVWAVPSTDLLTNLEDYLIPGRQYFWISFSRSGESSEGVAVLRRALRDYRQIRHLVITCSASGTMAELCSRRPDQALAFVLDEAVNDRGLAMTSSFSNMVVAGHCLAHLSNLAEYGGVLEPMVEAGGRFLCQAAEKVSWLAELRCPKACFVGSGTLAAVANESALKLLELTAGKIHTMSESVLGLRHGPMSALDANTLFVLFMSSHDPRQKYELDLLKEIRDKQLGRVIVAVTARQSDAVESLSDHVLSLELPPGFADEYRPPVDIILGQLLGLFCCLNEGLQPDRPSPHNAISRVVSHVNIYS